MRKTKLIDTVLSSDNLRRKIFEKNRKFTLIFPEISGNLLITYANQLFSSQTLQSNAVK